MKLANQLLRSGSGMIVAQSAILLLTFARNIMLARMLGAEQFGIATTFAISMVILEAAFEFAPDKYMLRAPEGDHTEVLGATHTFTVARGLCAGFVLFLAAGPIAALFHVPDLAWAYRILALAPVIRGFTHFDFRRRQRNLSYRHEILITLASHAAAFAVALAVALVHRSHVAMLASLLAQVSVLVALSFLVARTPYRLSGSRPELKTLFQFGWPLVLSNLIITAAMQGDRGLVGAAFGPQTLAVYATAAMLAGAPYLILLRVVGIMMLPVLGPLRGQPQFKVRYEHIGASLAFVVLALIVPVALLGSLVIPLVFGTAYRPDPLVVGALAAAAGVSLLRAWTNIAALSVGNSKAVLYTDCVRLSGLVLAGIGVLAGGGLPVVALSMAAGEVAGLVFGLLRTHRINGLPTTTGITFIAPTIVTIFIMLPLADEVYALGWPLAMLVTVALQVAGLISLLALSARARAVLRGAFAALRP